MLLGGDHPRKMWHAAPLAKEILEADRASRTLHAAGAVPRQAGMCLIAAICSVLLSLRSGTVLPHRSCIELVRVCSHFRPLCSYLAMLTLCTATMCCSRPDPCHSVSLLKHDKLDASSL